MNRFKPTFMCTAAAALVLTATTALAGSGAGGVFNLGQVNNVDGQTVLSGNPGGNPLLKVTTAGTAAAVRGVASNGIGTNGISTSGVGQQGLSDSGIGTLGTHGNTTGISPGVQGETNSTDAKGAGVVGKNNGGGPGLRAIVNPGAPPLAVNSQAKVANLNADLLDGLDSPALQKRVTGTCAAGSAVKSVNADGTVVCEPVGGGGVWSLNGNSGTTPGTNFVGTTDNQPLELKVGGQRALRIEPTGFTPNLVGGSSFNSVAFLAVGSAIAGGGTNLATYANHTEASYDFIGAGYGNQAGAPGGQIASGVVAGTTNAATGGWAFIGAGGGNQAGGDYAAVAGGSSDWANGYASFIGGGSNNRATGDYSLVGGGGTNVVVNLYSAVVGGHANSAAGDYASVAGGDSNTAGGLDSAVSGGSFNTANGGRSVVIGGYGNTASGENSGVSAGYHNTASSGNSVVAGGEDSTASGFDSFAAGQRAKATNDGSFVWGDHTPTDLNSPGVNTFTVRASGGIWLGTTSSPSIPAGRFVNTSTGGYLSTGGAWVDASDRALKHDFRPLKKQSVVDKVARMPITSWSYKAEKPSVRHIGPMAQDFYKAFGLGLDNKHIATIDEGGVALAAVQDLYRENRQLTRENAVLSARLGRVERMVASLKEGGHS